MNHIYRSVWNEATRTFVAAAESIRGRGKRSRSSRGAAGAHAGEAATAVHEALGIVPAGLRLMALEQRFMFDGAGAVDAVNTLDMPPEPAPQTQPEPAVDEVIEQAASYVPPTDEEQQREQGSEVEAQPSTQAQESTAIPDDATSAEESMSEADAEGAIADQPAITQLILQPSDLLSEDAAATLNQALADANRTLTDLAGTERFEEIAKDV
jgi:hypothetical protein